MKIGILTNGEYGDYSFCKEMTSYDYIICADNGIKHARVLGIVPHYILGDFDSALEEDRAYFKDIETYKVPGMKDETDTELAVDKALALGATSIDILGGLGSRIDHSLANIHLLYKGLKQNTRIRLMNAHNTVYLIDKEISLEGHPEELVSLLPLTMEVKGIYTEGLAYGLEDARFCLGKPYGVSNVMTDSSFKVRIEQGLLLVIKARD